MIDVKQFYNTLCSNGISMFTGVPDSLLKDFCAYIRDNSDNKHNIIAANEGAALGIAVGHHLASGKLPLVYMQNSGLGNAVNPILSLADDKVYSIPMILLIGWRGEPGVHDEPQHVRQGEVTLPMLDAMRVPYTVLSTDNDEALTQTESAIKTATASSKPYALIVRKNSFSKYTLQNSAKSDFELSREEALRILVSNMPGDSIAVSTTGKLSRELFELRESNNDSHSNDFLTVGSMGHSSSIALGIALERPNRTIWCLDGDGAFIMHMGAITNIGHLMPVNFKHIVFNNGAHESVGAQPTVGFNIDIPKIAEACGYKYYESVSSKEELINALKSINDIPGPAMLEIKIHVGAREDLGRPTTTPAENKVALMKVLKKSL